MSMRGHLDSSYAVPESLSRMRIRAHLPVYVSILSILSVKSMQSVVISALRKMDSWRTLADSSPPRPAPRAPVR
jgi:hypothetical protein